MQFKSLIAGLVIVMAFGLTSCTQDDTMSNIEDNMEVQADGGGKNVQKTEGPD